MQEVLWVPRILLDHSHDGIYLGNLVRMEVRRKTEGDPVESESGAE